MKSLERSHPHQPEKSVIVEQAQQERSRKEILDQESTTDERVRSMESAKQLRALESSGAYHSHQIQLLLDQADGKTSDPRAVYEESPETFSSAVQGMLDVKKDVSPADQIAKSGSIVALGEHLTQSLEKQIQYITVRKIRTNEQIATAEQALLAHDNASAPQRFWKIISGKGSGLKQSIDQLKAVNNALEKEEILLLQQKSFVESQIETLRAHQNDTLRVLIDGHLREIRKEYEQLWNQEKKSGIVMDQTFVAYWKQFIDPMIDNLLRSEGENKEVIRKELYAAINHHIHTRRSHQMDDGTMRNQLQKTIYSLLQNKERSYPYDLDRALEPLVGGDLERTLRRTFNHFVVPTFDQIEGEVFKRRGKGLSDALKSSFQAARDEQREFSDRDSSIQKLTVKSVNVPIWKCVQQSPSARQVFTGEALDDLDQECYRQTIDAGLSDDGQGWDIDGLVHYPTPEVIRILAVMAAADNNSYRLNHVNTVIDKLAGRSDWNDLLEKTVAQYPDLQPMQKTLLEWKSTPQFVSYANARHPTIRNGVDGLLLTIIGNAQEDPRLVKVAYEAGTDGVILETLVRKGALSREDCNELQQAMQTIKSMEGPYVHGEVSVRSDWLNEFVRKSTLQGIDSLGKPEEPRYSWQPQLMGALPKCVAIARAINGCSLTDQKKSLAFLSGYQAIDILKRSLTTETVEAVLSLAQYDELLDQKDGGVGALPALKAMLGDERRSYFFTKEFVSMYRSIPSEYRAWVDQLPPEAQRQLITNMPTILKEDMLSLYASMPPSAFSIVTVDQIATIPRERRAVYIDVFSRISTSPSQEIQRLRDMLVQQLLETEDPVARYQKIEEVFVKNNLPMVGKIYQVFHILYPAAKLKQILPKPESNELRGKAELSPVLRAATARRREWIIYHDLLATHLRSGNRSLREYLTVLQDGEAIVTALDAKGLEAMSADEQEQLQYFLNKVDTLFHRSQLGVRQGGDAYSSGDGQLQDRLNTLRQQLGVREGQPITDRLSEMFLKPIGIHSITEARSVMNESLSSAHARSLQLAKELTHHPLTLSAGDLLKGVNVSYISNILQNGSVAGEYLGASSGSDLTPLDTDVSMVLPKHIGGTTEQIVQASLATGYGELLFVVKDRGQFQQTTGQKDARYDEGKLELFCTAVHGERHYGIRTGFPTTEIDCMIATPQLQQNQRQMDKIYYEIAQNGFYIPVVDTKGNSIFTPEQYEQYRHVFDGVDVYQGDALAVHPTTESDPQWQDVMDIQAAHRKDQERVERLRSEIRTHIQSVLSRHDITLKSPYDTSIIGAELFDIGSTGRGTNMSGDADFDFMVRLDNKDFDKVPGIAKEIMQTFQPTKDDSHAESEYYLLRAMGATALSQSGADIDIGFVKKSELVTYGSHDAVGDKLEWIKEHKGKEQYESVIANIIVAKKILKQGDAYKRQEQGGMGGIGVENWILGHGGNLREAFESFYTAAHDHGSRTPFEEFKGRYRVLDAGTNLKKGSHGDFIYGLTAQGYEKMLNVIAGYLAKNKEPITTPTN